jgi:site-specific recombinase XerD
MSDLLIKSWKFQWAALGRAPRTIREYERHVRRFEAVLVADGRDLLSATRQDCEAHLASIESAPMRAYCWRALRSFYAFISEEEETPSIMVRVKCPRVALTEVSTASQSDYDALMKACSPFRTGTQARDAAIVSVFWACGLRRSELAALTMSDIDLDTMTLVVRTSKTGRSRRVPFDAKTASILMRWMSKRATWPTGAETDALWLGRKGALTSDGIRLVMERLRKKAGVSISSHSFRRGLAARALRLGVSGPSTSAILGWSASSPMLGHYVRGVQAELAHDEYRQRLG